MAFRQLIRIVIYITLYSNLAMLTAGCTTQKSSVIDIDEYYDTWELDHPGHYKLVWYYTTKKDWQMRHPNKVLVHNKEFLVDRNVRPPMINGVYLLKYSTVNEGEEILDIGTGTGLHAIFAAEKAKRVVATDIYGPAIENAKTNARLHGVEEKIDFRIGDLFEPIDDGEKFDVFFININFPDYPDDRKRNNLHERFFDEVRKHMKPNARIYYQTSFIKNIPYIYDMLKRNNFSIIEMHTEHFLPYKHEALFMMIQDNQTVI